MERESAESMRYFDKGRKERRLEEWDEDRF